ncbi:MAG: sugar-binding domain-containing protein, partial [Prolixibacteraceae bacterium]
MRIRTVFFIAAAMFTACTHQFQQNRNQSFNQGWKFLKENPENAMASNFDDSQWRSVDLPHDISVEDLQIQDSIHIGPFFNGIEKGIDVGFLSGGTAWYRKSFQLEPEDIGQQVILNFDGVHSEAIVFVNGKQLAEHKYGYTPFKVNITPYLVEAGNVNVVAVKVTNQEQSSRWYTGFGIYRNVTLSVIAPVHIADWGVAVTTALVNENEAVVKFAVQVENTKQSEETVQIKTEIIAPDQTVLQTIDQKLIVNSNGQTNSNFELSIANPVLWNLESPNLYSAKVMLIHSGQQKDEYLVNFGIRTIEFSADKGFLLNGKPVLLKGACMHHDNGILGAAAFKTAEYRRVAIMKKNGFNAIRTSHNPPS